MVEIRREKNKEKKNEEMKGRTWDIIIFSCFFFQCRESPLFLLVSFCTIVFKFLKIFLRILFLIFFIILFSHDHTLSNQTQKF